MEIITNRLQEGLEIYADCRNYAELVSRFQQIKQRSWKLNPYDLFISFNLLLIPPAPLVVPDSK